VPKETFAARAAKWSASHWKTATFGWLAFVVAAIVVGSAVGSVKLTDAEQSTGESARAQQILADAGFSQPAAESVLVQSQTATTSDPSFRQTIARVVTRLNERHMLLAWISLFVVALTDLYIRLLAQGHLHDFKII